MWGTCRSFASSAGFEQGLLAQEEGRGQATGDTLQRGLSCPRGRKGTVTMGVCRETCDRAHVGLSSPPIPLSQVTVSAQGKEAAAERRCSSRQRSWQDPKKRVGIL